MKRCLILFFVASAAHADPAFWDQAVALMQAGKLQEAQVLTTAALKAAAADPDALVIAGTLEAYRSMTNRRDDSIYRPNVDTASEGEPALSPAAAAAVAGFWKAVPAADPSRGYLWGDLAQMTYRSGDSARALEYAAQALADPAASEETLRSAASVFELNLQWSKAAEALQRIPKETTGSLYAGLEAWRTGKDNWRIPLKAFVDGGARPGSKLAAYLLGPAMRDTESGFIEAVKTEEGIAPLAVMQKYVDRYPGKFQPRLDFARMLSQLGSFDLAVAQFTEISRRSLASTPEEKEAALFQEAWARQGAGKPERRLWELLAESRDFYIRSAACWFLGQAAGTPAEAREWWGKVADEPARSKYAYWANAELKKLK